MSSSSSVLYPPFLSQKWTQNDQGRKTELKESKANKPLACYAKKRIKKRGGLNPFQNSKNVRLHQPTLLLPDVFFFFFPERICSPSSLQDTVCFTVSLFVQWCLRLRCKKKVPWSARSRTCWRLMRDLSGTLLHRQSQGEPQSQNNR